MRPLPQGHKGLTLVANGNLEPVGEEYVKMAVNAGVAARPGDRVVITDVKINRTSIVFDLNGGPDLKHRFLRHIHVGMGPVMDTPVVQDNGDIPTGARLTLAFKGAIPQLTGKQVQELLAPLVSFEVKTPVKAYTDTLPKPLKEAILNHQVWVGMSTQMVLYSMGRPWTKYRAMDGQMPYEEWIYGHPPQPTTFVRINGNRVIQVEVGRVGKPLEVFTKDVVSPMMLSNGTEMAANPNVRIIREGDVQPDPNKEAPPPPPTLLKPGEKAPTAIHGAGQMRPVYFPKDQQKPTQGKNPDDQQPASPPAAPQTPSGQETRSSVTKPPDSSPTNGSEPPNATDGNQSGAQSSSSSSH